MPLSPEDKIKYAERDREVLELRKSGATYRDIGAELGISQTRACQIVTKAIADIPRPAADELRQIEVERLDKLQESVWKLATEGGDLAAIDRIVRIVDRRARLLGLDAPQRVEVAAGDVDLDSTVSKLLRVAELAGNDEGAVSDVEGEGD